jgi:transposase-like protein
VKYFKAINGDSIAMPGPQQLSKWRKQLSETSKSIEKDFTMKLAVYEAEKDALVVTGAPSKKER